MTAFIIAVRWSGDDHRCEEAGRMDRTVAVIVLVLAGQEFLVIGKVFLIKRSIVRISLACSGIAKEIA